MTFKKVLLLILVLPITLLLDLVLYAFIRTCPTCGSFRSWLVSEGALSFPLVVSLTEYLEQVFKGLSIKNSYNNQITNPKSQTISKFKTPIFKV